MFLPLSPTFSNFGMTPCLTLLFILRADSIDEERSHPGYDPCHRRVGIHSSEMSTSSWDPFVVQNLPHIHLQEPYYLTLLEYNTASFVTFRKS